MLKKKYKTRGFSLIELVVSISIISFLFTIIYQGYFKHQRDIEFNIAATDLKAALYEVRENSRTYKEQNVYGIHLENNRYQLFRGTSYTSEGVTLTTELPWFLSIGSIVLKMGGQSVVFEKNSGNTIDYGTFRLNADDGQSVLYEINQQGFINLDFDA